MSDPSILEIVTEYVSQELLEGDDDGLDASTPLLDGIWSSLEIPRFVVFLEKRFGVEVPADTVLAEKLENLETIATWVTELVRAKEASGS